MIPGLNKQYNVFYMCKNLFVHNNEESLNDQKYMRIFFEYIHVWYSYIPWIFWLGEPYRTAGTGTCTLWSCIYFLLDCRTRTVPGTLGVKSAEVLRAGLKVVFFSPTTGIVFASSDFQ